MNRRLIIITLIFGILVSCRNYKDYSDISWQEKDLPDWENTAVNTINTEYPHSSMVSFPDEATAMNAGWRQSPNVMSLNGMWKFNFVNTPAERPYWFYKDDFDTRGWKEISVPSTWEREGFGIPYYVNNGYPFRMNPPYIDHSNNPVGSYKRTFKVPSDWNDKEVFLTFDGVSAAFYVWINGQMVGYSEDSKSTAEFNITSFIKAGKNSIAVQVFRWCDGSYLEDQDFWRLSGIQRPVWLQARPKSFIRDYFAKSTLVNDYHDGHIDLGVNISNKSKSPESLKLETSIYDGSGKVFSNINDLGQVTDSSAARIEGDLKAVKPWSAESPSLYTLVLTLSDSNGKVLESVTSKIGFRTSEVKGSQFLVNGKPVHLKGVNTHEHDMVKGHTISEATILKDLTLMKKNNINAIRTSHYPQPERFYELCDKYGFYVVDEADIESHGIGYNKDVTLADKPEWLSQHMLRTTKIGRER